jgi:2'-5' RNA ligase
VTENTNNQEQGTPNQEGGNQNYRPRRRFGAEGQSGGGGGYRGGNRNNNSGGGGGYRSGGNRRPMNNRRGGPPQEKTMYYITLLCPPEVDDVIGAHKAMMKENYGCEVASKSPAHVTLIAPFFLSDGKKNQLVEMLQGFDSIISEVTVDINGYNHFNDRVIFADVVVNDNLTALQEQLENYLRNGGFPFIKEAKKPFHPHVTIATRDLKDKDFDAIWANFEGKEFTSSYATNTIHLMKLVEDRWVHEEQFVLQ